MFPQLGVPEMVVVMVVAVLLFGKRLPEVGRSLGKGIIEFKKGLRGLEGEFDFMGSSSHSSGSSSRRSEAERSRPSPTPADDDFPEMSVPKFEPPTTAPVAHQGSD